MKKIKENARNLRKNMTDQERKLWQILKNRQFYGYRFLRQFIIGNFIADFVCVAKKIVIELDGGQHNENDNAKYDEMRTKYLESKGYKVVRFWNNDIDGNIDGVYKKLEEVFGVRN